MAELPGRIIELILERHKAPRMQHIGKPVVSIFPISEDVVNDIAKRHFENRCDGYQRLSKLNVPEVERYSFEI